MNVERKEDFYKRICEMESEGKNWAEIASELKLRESTVLRIYLDGATGALFREPDVYDRVVKVVMYDIERMGGLVLEKGVEGKYRMYEHEFDKVVYILEACYGYERVIETKDGKRTVTLVKRSENK